MSFCDQEKQIKIIRLLHQVSDTVSRRYYEYLQLILST